MEILAGTSGFAYKAWKGHFYPDKIAQDRMLAFYAGRLPAVEINNTFYRMPSKSVVEKWRSQVPKSFRFVLKASRRITHQQRLKESEDSLGYLIESATGLGDQLGALLFQLPPYLRKDVGRLRNFLALLEGGPPAAFEFRHPSWFDDEVYATLSTGNAALCLADSDNDERNPPWTPTASWGYLRLRREDYDDRALEEWAARIAATDWSRAFVFFKHEDEGTGPKLAARLAALASECARSTFSG